MGKTIEKFDLRGNFPNPNPNLKADPILPGSKNFDPGPITTKNVHLI